MSDEKSEFRCVSERITNMKKEKNNCNLQFDDFVYDVVDGNAVITEYRGDKKTLYVPSYINGYQVIGFDVYNFGFEEPSYVRHIVFPGSIQKFSFWEHNMLETIRIESGCKAIPDEAFWYLKNLKLVDLPDTVVTIGKRAFAYCKSLEYIRIPNSCTYIGDNAFESSGLVDLFIPQSIKEMGKNPFCSCEFLSLHLHPENQNFKLIDDMILYTADRSRLIWCYPSYPKILQIPEELTSVDSSALMGCELYGFNIPSGCKAFDGTELKCYLM